MFFSICTLCFTLWLGSWDDSFPCHKTKPRFSWTLINSPIHSSTQAKACLCPRRRTSRITWAELEREGRKWSRKRRITADGCLKEEIPGNSEGKRELKKHVWALNVLFSPGLCVCERASGKQSAGQFDPGTGSAEIQEDGSGNER